MPGPHGYGPVPGQNGYGPVPPQSTRMLTVVKWVTVVLSALLTVACVFWVDAMHQKKEYLEQFKDLADRDSGDGKGLKGGEEAIASAEADIVIVTATLAAVALLGVMALLAGFGLRWAHVLTVFLTLGPMGVVVYGVVDGGSDSLYALVFLVPFIALTVLWCLPGTRRGMAVRRARRAATGRSAPTGRPR